MNQSTVRSVRSLIFLALAAGAFFVVGTAGADDYIWQGPDQMGGDGVFEDAYWYDITTDMGMTGPPGAGDSATIPLGSTVTTTGSEVESLDGSLVLDGPFTATTYVGGDITGSFQFTCTTVSNGANGATLNIDGVKFTADETGGYVDGSITGGGSLIFSGPITDLNYGVADAGSLLEIDGAAQSANIGVSGGAKFTAQSVTNDGKLTCDLTVKDAKSEISVTGDVEIEGRSLTASGQGEAMITGDFRIYQSTGLDGLGGSASLTDIGTVVIVGGGLYAGQASDTRPANVTFDQGVNAGVGGLFADGPTAYGPSVVTVSNGSILDVGAGGMQIGSQGAGELDVSSEASLTNEHGGDIGGGIVGSTGTASVDGAGTTWTIVHDTLGIGGSTDAQAVGAGSLTMSNKAKLQVEENLYVSASGTVTVESGAVIIVGSGTTGAAGALNITTGGSVGGRAKEVDAAVVNAGTFNPNAFHIGGSYQQTSAGEMDIQLRGPDPTTGHDEVFVTGEAQLGGTLRVTLGTGYSPPTGLSFTIVSAQSVKGKFDEVIGAEVVYTDKTVTVTPSRVDSTLNVSVSLDAQNHPEGTVTKGFLGASSREVGASYTVSATPAKGYVFDGWTGSVTSASPILRFVMEANTTLEANFVLNPFAPVAGSFAGLGANSSAPGPHQGLLSLTLNPTGAFTARFTLGGSGYAFSGSFLGDGSFVKSLTVGGKVVDVQFSLAFTSPAAITGQISIAGAAYSVTAGRSAFSSKSNPATIYAGSYTIVLPPDSAQVAPQGNGWATAKVAASGSVTISGRLADNTPWSAAGFLTETGTFDALAAFGSSHDGLIAGALTFAGAPRNASASVSDIMGTMEWSEPAVMVKKVVTKAAFDAALNPIGSFYQAPAKNMRVISGLDTSGDAQLQFSGGNLTTNPLTKQITISLLDRVTYPTPTSSKDKLMLTFTAASGAFTGTFYTGVKSTAFTGVVLQKQEEGDGFFLGASASGTVTLSP